MEGNANSGPFCWYVSNIPFPSDVYYYVSVNIILLLSLYQKCVNSLENVSGGERVVVIRVECQYMIE